MKRIQWDDGTLLRCERKCLVAIYHPVNRPAVYSIDGPGDRWELPRMRLLPQLQQQLLPNFLNGPLVEGQPVAMPCMFAPTHVCGGCCGGRVEPTMNVSQQLPADNRIAAIDRRVLASVRAIDCWMRMMSTMSTEGIRSGPSQVNVSSAIELHAVRI